MTFSILKTRVFARRPITVVSETKQQPRESKVDPGGGCGLGGRRPPALRRGTATLRKTQLPNARNPIRIEPAYLQNQASSAEPDAKRGDPSVRPSVRPTVCRV